MVADYKKKTDEELIAIVNKYMEDHPNATRNTIILNAAGNHARVRNLDKQGLIKLPKALPRGTGSSWGKYFYIDSKDKMFIR
jgi:rRNA pseudouridine-1189 N-methylase Emg1 (Nep1/Mra1 family)